MENNNNNNFGLICAIILGISLFFSSVGCSILSESLITGVYCSIPSEGAHAVSNGEYDYTMFSGVLYPFFVNPETGDGWYFSGSECPALWIHGFDNKWRTACKDTLGLDPYWDISGVIEALNDITDGNDDKAYGHDVVYKIMRYQNFDFLLDGSCTFMYYYNSEKDTLITLDNGSGGTMTGLINSGTFYNPMLNYTGSIIYESYPLTVFVDAGFRFYNYTLICGDYVEKKFYSVNRSYFNENSPYVPNELGAYTVADYHGSEYHNYLSKANPDFDIEFCATPDGLNGYSGITLRYNSTSFGSSSFDNLYCYFDYMTYDFNTLGLIDYTKSSFSRVYVPFNKLLEYTSNVGAGTYDYSLRIPFDDILTAFGRKETTTYVRLQGIGFFFANFNMTNSYYDSSSNSSTGSAGGSYVPDSEDSSSFIGKFPLDSSSYKVSGSNYYAFHYDDETSLQLATTITKRCINYISSSCISEESHDLLDEDGNKLNYEDTLNTLKNSTNDVIGNSNTLLSNLNKFFEGSEDALSGLKELFASLPPYVWYLLEFSLITVLLVLAFRKIGG